MEPERLGGETGQATGPAAREALDTTAEERPAPGRLRVMTYNVLAGGRPRLDALEAVIRSAQADVVGLEEVAPQTLDTLATRLGMRPAFGPSRRGSSVGLLSRWPLRETRTYPNAGLRNAVLEVVVEPPGGAPVRVWVTHLAARHRAWRAGESIRLREIGAILRRMTALLPTGEPQLLMGDFNSLPPGEPLLASQLLLLAAANDAERAKGVDLRGQPGIAEVIPAPLRPLGRPAVALMRAPSVARAFDGAVGLYVPRAVVGRVRAAGYVDLYAAAHPDPRARAMSCPARSPAGRIDYLFASPALASGLIACDILTEAPDCPVLRASDHLPALAELTLPAAQ